MLAANIDGSEKLEPLVIEKSAKPTCLKNFKYLPMTYCTNKKSWMTSQKFSEWLSTVTTQMEKKGMHSLLFVDNCTAHAWFPPLSHMSVNSKLQPLDQGIRAI